MVRKIKWCGLGDQENKILCKRLCMWKKIKWSKKGDSGCENLHGPRLFFSFWDGRKKTCGGFYFAAVVRSGEGRGHSHHGAGEGEKADSGGGSSYSPAGKSGG